MFNLLRPLARAARGTRTCRPLPFSAALPRRLLSASSEHGHSAAFAQDGSPTPAANVDTHSRGAGRTADFGFSTVEEDKKQGMVFDVFRNVADNYDLMNDLMSGSIHRLWKDEFVSMIGPIVSRKDVASRTADASRASSSASDGSPPGPAPNVVLDVAGGTGDIAFRIINALDRSFWKPAQPPRVIVCDINDNMLRVGEKRALARGLIGATASASNPDAPVLSFLQGNAECLPVESESVDLYTIAFGIRNVTHIDKALADAYRVLKPGGRFMCLEFSLVENPLFRSFYDSYSFAVIPFLGQVFANDKASYQYLVESIRKFPNQEDFAEMIRTAGFQHVSYRNFTGGVCAVHSGFKF